MTILLSTIILNLQMMFGFGNVTRVQVNSAMVQAQQSGAIVLVDTLEMN